MGYGAAAPKASHRCMRQPGRATMWSSSGSSRPRRPWMRRRKMAVASDEDLGRKTSWGNGIFTWGSGWNVDGSSSFNTSLFCGKCFAKTFGTDILCCSLWSRLYCADTILMWRSHYMIWSACSNQRFFRFICEFGLLHQFHHMRTVADCILWRPKRGQIFLSWSMFASIQAMLFINMATRLQ